MFVYVTVSVCTHGVWRQHGVLDDIERLEDILGHHLVGLVGGHALEELGVRKGNGRLPGSPRRLRPPQALMDWKRERKDVISVSSRVGG